MTAFLPPVGEPPSIELLPPRRLAIDDSYQRSIATQPSQRLINRIAREWDWRLCVPLLVSRRDAGLFVIDGQHRLEGARKRGDIAYLPCCVSEYGSPADEAAVFVAANRKRRGVTTVDTFRAALLAGDHRAVSIGELLAAAGLRLARTSRLTEPGEVACTGALQRLHDQRGRVDLGVTLAVFARAFPAEVVAQQAPMLAAIAAILAGADGRDGAAGLGNVLAQRSAALWWERAKTEPMFVHGSPGHVLALRRAIDQAIDGRPAPSDQPASPPARQPASWRRQARADARGAVGGCAGWRSSRRGDATPPPRSRRDAGRRRERDAVG